MSNALQTGPAIRRPALRLAELRAQFEVVRPCGPAMIAMALVTIRDADPELFARLGVDHDDPSTDAQLLFATLDQIVANVHRFHVLEAPLARAGRQARGRGLTRADFVTLRSALLLALSGLLADEWTTHTHARWRLLADAVIGAMLAGAHATAIAHTPAASHAKAA